MQVINWTWKLRIIWKGVGVGLAVLGLAGFIWTFSLWNWQLDHLPRFPNSTLGQIYPRNIHGIVVYQNRKELDYLETIQASAVAMFTASVLLSFAYKWKWGTSK